MTKVTQLNPDSRTSDGRFKKGVSGNPGGRSSMVADVRRELSKNWESAVQSLLKLMASDNEQVAMAALREYFDRLVGKATITQDVTRDHFEEVSDKEVLEKVKETIKLIEENAA
jgi:hypothetical protein